MEIGFGRCFPSYSPLLIQFAFPIPTGKHHSVLHGDFKADCSVSGRFPADISLVASTECHLPDSLCYYQGNDFSTFTAQQIKEKYALHYDFTILKTNVWLESSGIKLTRALSVHLNPFQMLITRFLKT